MAETTTIRLPPKLRARIHALAKQSGRSAHSIILEVVERHADYEEQMHSLVKESIEADEQIDRTGAVYLPVVGLTGDVSDAAVPAGLVDEAVKALGGLDLLVTNAGGPPAGAFESFEEATWQKAVDLSFLSHVRTIRAALPHLRHSTAASVLTMTSYTAKQPLPNLVLSNSIRLATIGLTKTLALELGGDGIRFNSILPATIDTDRVRELAQFRADKNKTGLAEEQAKDDQKSVFGRIGRREEFANVAVFLLSPAASYITGMMMLVDGGQYKGKL